MAKSELSNNKLAQWDRDYVWHPFTQQREWTQSDPLFIDRGEGVYLVARDGVRYLDGVSSLWANIHGHGVDRIDRAIADQLKKIAHTTMLGLSHEPATVLAKRLIDVAPAGLKRVFYSESGSTAVEIALKMAYQYLAEPGEQGKRHLPQAE